jgi:uncharacterized protein
MPISVKPIAGGVQISVKVVPGASRDRIVGEFGDALKIAVSKPPQDGAANAAVIELLSKALGVPRRSVTILKGHAQPRKQIAITGVNVEDAMKRITEG